MTSANRDVSRFALIAAALVFGAFIAFVVGAAIGRDLLNSPFGSLTGGVWLLLVVHVLPVVLGIVHLARAWRADQTQEQQR